MAKLISQSCGESQSAFCLSKKDGAIWRPPSTRGCQTDLRKRPEWRQTVQPSLLIHWCSKQMVMKSVSWNCACIRPLLAYLVTYAALSHIPCLITNLLVLLIKHSTRHWGHYSLQLPVAVTVLVFHVTSIHWKVVQDTHHWLLSQQHRSLYCNLLWSCYCSQPYVQWSYYWLLLWLLVNCLYW